MRPTCTDCALKHLSQASILLSEFHQGYPTHIFYALGHMAEAGDELVKEYPKHAEMVRAERKKLEENPDYSPDFNQLLEKIDTECEVCSLANPGKKHNPGNPGPRREYKPSAWTKCELKYPSVQRKIASCAKEIEKRQTCPPSKWGTSPSCVNPYAVCRTTIKCPPNPGKDYEPSKYRTIDGEQWLLTAGSSRGLPGPELYADLERHKEYIKGLGYEIRCFKESDGDYYCWAKYVGETENPGNPGAVVTGNPGNPSKYMQRGQTLPARQMWLLREMCRRRGVDTKLIDPAIDYWENKAEIEREALVRLRLKLRKNNNNLRGPVVNNDEGRAVAGVLRQKEREEEEAYAEYARAFKENH